MTEMMKENTNIKKVPNLRFPGFEREWEVKRLGKLADIQSGYAFKSKYFKEGGLKLVIPKNFTKFGFGNFDNNISKFSSEIPPVNYKCKEGDLLVLLTDLTPSCELLGKPLFIKKEDGDVWLNQRIIRLDSSDEILKNWLLYFLLTEKYHKLIRETATGSTVRHSSNKILSRITLSVPVLPEQQKIASFLSLIDERIQTQNKIIGELKLLKRALIKKIFFHHLKFKDNNGNNYPDWKIKKLGDIGETYSGLTGKTKENFGSGKPYIQYKQIFDRSKIDTSKCDLVSIVSNEKQNRVKKGDIFFTISSETPEEIGMSSVLLDEVDEMYLNSFCFGYRLNSIDILNPYLARYLFRSDIFRNEIIKLAQGSTRYNMSKIGFLKLELYLPCIEEQTKIANFLSTLDSKVGIETKLLIQLKNQKKYLLQNLFI